MRSSTVCATATAPWSRGSCAFSFIGLVVVAVAGAGIYGTGEAHAYGLPARGRPGRIVRCRAAARRRAVARTSEAVRQAENILREEEAVADYTSVIGLNFIDNYSQPNAAFMVVTLKPFEERKDRSLGAPALIAPAECQVPEIAAEP